MNDREPMSSRNPFKKFRIGFFGAAPFVISFLEALQLSRHEIAFIVTSTDKPQGRGKQLVQPAAKVFAASHSIPCLQPNSVRDNAFHNRIAAFSADLFIVIAYGRILPKELLEMPGTGSFNLHFSLLPRWRGAAPVQHAILNGDVESGVTIMKMDAGLDTGDILLQQRIPIGLETSAPELFDSMIQAGILLLHDALEVLERGSAVYTRQDEAASTYAPALRKDEGLIDWKKNAGVIHNAVRGLQPWPGCYAFLDGRRIKIWKTCVIHKKGEPGVIHEIVKDGFLVGTGRHSIKVLELQEEGRNRMLCSEFLRGRVDLHGKSFDIAG